MKRPNSKRNLDMAIRRLGSSDVEYVRMRTAIANAIVGQLLPGGVVKGGAAIKMRYGDAQTRATIDLDATKKGDEKKFIAQLSERLAVGWCDFTGRVVPREMAHPEGVSFDYVMRPFDVKLDYLGAAWCTVPLEVGHEEIGDADQPDFVIPRDAGSLLARLGFQDVRPVPTMPLEHQIAQKLHGLSEKGSKRAHDLIDLQIIERNGNVDYRRAHKCCIRLFASRKAQSWPPHIVKGEGWAELYAAQCEGLCVAQDIDEAIVWGNDLIERIDKAAGAELSS